MKYFVTSDVHGYYDVLMGSLKAAGFDAENEEHVLICCGDLFDRGLGAVELFNFVKGLGDRFVYVRGNHEILLRGCVEQMASGKIPEEYHFSNGTVMTVLQFCGLTMGQYYDMLWDAKREDSDLSAFKVFEEKTSEVLEFVQTSKWYYELGDKVFLHGWFPRDFKDAGDEDWNRACWVNGMDAWRRGSRMEGKTVCCGHWSCSWGWNVFEGRKKFPGLEDKDWELSFVPFERDGLVALDACVGYSGKLNVVCFEE